MTRYFFVVLVMGLIGVAIIVKVLSSCLPNVSTGKMLPTAL